MVSTQSPEENNAAPAVASARIFMSRAVVAWGFGALFYNVTNNAVYAAFVRSIGANDFVFGVLAAALPLMSLLQAAAARLVEQTGRRRRQMLLAGLSARALWLVAALLPLSSWRYPSLIPRSAVLPLVVGAILAAGACQAFTVPAFFSWIGDVIPLRLRAPFFARRMQVGTWVAIVVMLLSGKIADIFPSLPAYCAILAVTAVLGMVEFGLFGTMREPVQTAPASESTDEGMASARSLFEPLRDTAVRRFLAFTCLMFLGYGSLGAFSWLHALEYLKFSKTMGGMIFIASMLAQAFVSRFWGRVIKRHGARPVLRLTSAALTLIPLCWILAPGPAAGIWLPWCLLLATMFCSGIVYSGYDLSNVNIVTNLSPHLSRATMAALFAIVSDLSMVTASWISGAVAQALHGWSYELWGFTIIKYHVVFAGSCGVRVIGAFLLAPLLCEPKASGTRAMVKATAPEVAGALNTLWIRSWAWLR
jgi:MFS family permease